MAQQLDAGAGGRCSKAWPWRLVSEEAGGFQPWRLASVGRDQQQWDTVPYELRPAASGFSWQGGQSAGLPGVKQVFSSRESRSNAAGGWAGVDGVDTELTVCNAPGWQWSLGAGTIPAQGGRWTVSLSRGVRQ